MDGQRNSHFRTSWWARLLLWSTAIGIAIFPGCRGCKDYDPWVKISVTERTEQDQLNTAPSATQQGILTLSTRSRDSNSNDPYLKGIWEYEDQQGKTHKVSLSGSLDGYSGNLAKFSLDTVAGEGSNCEDNTSEERHSISGTIDLRTGIVQLSAWKHCWCTEEKLYESELKSLCARAIRSRTTPAE